MERQNKKITFQKLFRRKKSSEVPKLVFTYQKEEDGFTSDTDTYDGHADHYSNHQPSLAIDNFLDKSDCLSVRSFKNSNLDVQNLMDKMETVNFCTFKSMSLMLLLINFVKASIMMNQEKETEEIKLEKRQRFWDFLTMILSISYAIFIIMVGKII